MKITGALLIASAAAKCGNYACVQEISASGCSGTCNQDGYCNAGGKACSERLASNDWSKLRQYQSKARSAGSKKNIDHNLIGATSPERLELALPSRPGTGSTDGETA